MLKKEGVVNMFKVGDVLILKKAGKCDLLPVGTQVTVVSTDEPVGPRPKYWVRYSGIVPKGASKFCEGLSHTEVMCVPVGEEDNYATIVSRNN